MRGATFRLPRLSVCRTPLGWGCGGHLQGQGPWALSVLAERGLPPEAADWNDPRPLACVSPLWNVSVGGRPGDQKPKAQWDGKGEHRPKEAAEGCPSVARPFSSPLTPSAMYQLTHVLDGRWAVLRNCWVLASRENTSCFPLAFLFFPGTSQGCLFSVLLIFFTF